MLVSRWVERFRRRSTLLWTAAALVLTWVFGWLNPKTCEYTTYGDGVSLPLPYYLPFVPRTNAQAVAYSHLIQVLNVVEPPLQGLTLVLIAGVIWSRAVHRERLVLLPLLVPLFTALLLLAEGAFQLWVDLDRTAYELGGQLYLMELMMERTLKVSWCLIGLGLGVLLVRSLYRRVRREQVST